MLPVMMTAHQRHDIPKQLHLLCLPTEVHPKGRGNVMGVGTGRGSGLSSVFVELFSRDYREVSMG